MIAALITDYERAVLDKLRADARLRLVVEGISMLPATAEQEAHTREIYNNEWRRKQGKDLISEEQAAAELAHHERCQEDFRLSYKARGYKPPYEYGTGRVKVIFQSIEGGSTGGGLPAASAGGGSRQGDTGHGLQIVK